MIDKKQTVGDLVKEKTSRSRVFEQLDIDYCCGGKVPLEEACKEKGLDPNTVAKMLEAIESVGNSTPDGEYGQMSVNDLIDNILDTHHAYLRRELPRLNELSEKVVNAHGDKDDRVVTLRNLYVSLQNELIDHMQKEEQILFPAARKLAGGDAPDGSMQQPISVMEHEHDNAGEALAKFRELTDDYALPEWACNTYRALIDGLRELELDLHQHIHKENNILFPRVMEMEQKQQSPA